MNQTPNYDDELSLKDIYLVLKAYRKVILLAPVVSLFLALAFTILFITPRYEAYGNVQLGQVNGKLLEGVFVAAKRMNDRGFISGLINSHQDLFMLEGSLTKVSEFANHFVVKKDKDTELVSFSVRGRSSERAKAKALAVIEALQAAHRPILDANISMIKAQIGNVDQQLELIREQQKQLKGGKTAQENLNNYNAVVDSLIFQDRASQQRVLTSRKLELEASLSPAITFNTRLLQDVYVSEDPVSPNLTLIGMAAVLLGLFVAIFGAFLHHALKQE